MRYDSSTSPCCRFRTDGNPTLEKKSTLHSLMNDEFYQKLREKALKGIPIPGCQKCYDQEACGTPSLRQTSNKTSLLTGNLNKTSDLGNIDSLEIFLGDRCNLKCVTCGPELSSSWRLDYKKMAWPMPPQIRPQIETLLPELPKLTSLTELKLVGGEPFLYREQLPILEALATRASSINLVYFTNLTHIPSKELLKLWTSFKRVQVFLSIDGYKKINDYLRYPSQWKNIEVNMRKFFDLAKNNQNIELFVFTTVSALNVWTLNDLNKWYHREFTDRSPTFTTKLIFNPLEAPEHLSINNLTSLQRKNAISRLSQKSSNEMRVINWLKGFSFSNKQNELLEYLSRLDQMRNLNSMDLFPEIFETQV